MTNLATQNDVRDALRRELTADEALWIDSLLAEASDLVAGYLSPYQIPESIPAPITRVVAAMAAAVLTRPSTLLPDTQSVTADIYGVTFQPGATSPGPYLTDAFKKRLRPFRAGNVVVGVNSERSE